MVSHFFRALTECRDPPGEEGEQGLELPEAWGAMEPTDRVMLPSLPAAEYDSTEEKEREIHVLVIQILRLLSPTKLMDGSHRFSCWLFPLNTLEL